MDASITRPTGGRYTSRRDDHTRHQKERHKQNTAKKEGPGLQGNGDQEVCAHRKGHSDLSAPEPHCGLTQHNSCPNSAIDGTNKTRSPDTAPLVHKQHTYGTSGLPSVVRCLQWRGLPCPNTVLEAVSVDRGVCEVNDPPCLHLVLPLCVAVSVL